MTSHLARLILRLFGWHVVDLPVRPRQAVIIGYPHTSNWDFPVGILAITALGLDARWAGKNTLFRAPFGALMRALGGIPIDRSSTDGLVEQLVEEFHRTERFNLVLTPEGTRSHTPGWKTGFYRIAQAAQVPVLLGVIDAGQRQIGLVAQVDLTGDVEADLRAIAGHYEGRSGFRAPLASPIRFG